MTEEEAYKQAFSQGVAEFHKHALAMPNIGGVISEGVARLGKGVQGLGRRTSRFGQNVGDALQDRAADVGSLINKAPKAPIAGAAVGMASGAMAGAGTTEKKPWENIPGMDKNYKKRKLRRAIVGGGLGMIGGGAAGHGLQTAHNLAGATKLSEVRVFRDLFRSDD